MRRTVYTSNWDAVKRALLFPEDPEVGPVEGVSLAEERVLMGKTAVTLDFDDDTEAARARLRQMARREARAGGDPDAAEAMIRFRNEL